MRRASQAACRLLFRYQQQQLQLRCEIGHVAVKAAANIAHVFPPAAVSAPDAIATTCQASGSGRAVLLDGRAIAASWERELLVDVQRLTELLGRAPGLGVVLVGSRPDSMLYVTKKQEACQKAGMQTFVHHLPDTVSQAQLEAAVSHVCADCRVDGVLIQLPLPRHLSEEAVMEVLDPRKDVDGFHPLNMGRMLMRGRGVRLVPATPLGCIELLRRSGVDVQGKTCVVLGDSNTVGTPLAAMLRDKGAAAVTICHRRSYREWFEDQDLVQQKRAAAAVCLPRLPGPSPQPPSLAAAREAAAPPASDPLVGGGGRAGGGSPSMECFQSYQLPDLTRSADILVVAVGHPELVRGDWVRPGAVVIDVGINVVSTRSRGSAATAAAGSSATTVSASTSGTSPDGGDASESGRLAAAAAAAAECNDEACGGDECGSNDDGIGNGGNPNGISCTNGGSPYSRNVVFQVVGDVAYDEVSQVAGAITPVPGGVGPMTIAAVLHNTIKAAKYRAGLEPW